MTTEKARPLAALAFARFGLGARPGDRAAIGDDPKAALLEEIRTAAVPMPAGPEIQDSKTCLQALFDYQREVQRRAKENAAAAPTPGVAIAPPNAMTPPVPPATGAGAAAPMQPPLEGPGKRLFAEVQARFDAALTPRLGFGERLAMFWSNHFAVSVAKGGPVIALAGAYEREAIRPFVFGRFADMLLAVAKHPAMLFYLDNHLSTGRNSRFGKRAGLNENLAREILELHTLGVAGGYSQADVTSFAKIITGWRFVGAQGVGERVPGTFEFVAQAHEPGVHRLLGKNYASDGVKRGEDALRDLAGHPATATFLARKLARHFVADNPPEPLVARLAKTFRDTDGDLAAVSRALIEAPEAWTPEATKLRTPVEFLIAAARLVGNSGRAPGTLNTLNAMGQPLWQPPGPNGFPDTEEVWANPEGIKTRVHVAFSIGRLAGARIDPRALAEDIFGPALSPQTGQAIARAESKPQGLAILLMSPEFQRR